MFCEFAAFVDEKPKNQFSLNSALTLHIIKLYECVFVSMIFMGME